MNPVVKYTLGRVGLFAGALLILWPVPLHFVLKLLVALVVSFGLAWLVLRGWRDELANYLAARAERRDAERAELRATLEEEYGDPDTEQRS